LVLFSNEEFLKEPFLNLTWQYHIKQLYLFPLLNLNSRKWDLEKGFFLNKG